MPDRGVRENRLTRFQEVALVTTDAHILQLRDKHSHLHRKIEEEEQRPVPDSLRISEMKRAKLRIKDEIVELKHS